MKYNVEVSWDGASELVKSILSEDFYSVKKTVQEIESGINVLDKDEIDYYRSLLEAIKKVYEYYSIPGSTLE